LEERTNFDLEMIRGRGIVLESKITPLSWPFAELDPFAYCYFPKDYLMVVDESHVTLSQVSAMYGGDRSRKENLVEYGFRLPAAMDRPLKFEEFKPCKIKSYTYPQHQLIMNYKKPKGGCRTGNSSYRFIRSHC
jgi:excinuclease ABC subunit B